MVGAALSQKFGPLKKNDTLFKNISIAMFKKNIDDNKQLLKIKLQGMGEPLVNNNFYNMVEYASKYSIVSEITTNGEPSSDHIFL